MMTADEKNHVISNANDELDRQLLRFDTIFPHIANEISEESRLGSLSHWAYTNRHTAKAAANERPRREAASNRQDLSHAFHDVDVVSQAKREAASARKQRRVHADSDFDDPRTHARKGHVGKSRGGTHEADHGTTTKRRKVERPPTVDTATAMERSASGPGTSGRNTSKDTQDVKKRSRAPNTNASRKRYEPSSESGLVALIWIEMRLPRRRVRPFWHRLLLLGPSILLGLLRALHRIPAGRSLLVYRTMVCKTDANDRHLRHQTE